jgi:hypothetical protein
LSVVTFTSKEPLRVQIRQKSLIIYDAWWRLGVDEQRIISGDGAMNQRAFFLGAFALAFIALFTHAVARGFLTDVSHRKAARLAQAQKQQIAYIPDEQVVQSRKSYEVLTVVGIGLTALSVLCTVTALIRREPGWYLILTLLLFFNVLSLLLV